MSLLTIDLRRALNIRVPDAAGVEQPYELHEGLNDVPREVAEHWYVKKFCRPLRSVPRFVVPSSARPPAVISTMAEAIAPIAQPVAAEAAPQAPAKD
jgi:hypothetical protein